MIWSLKQITGVICTAEDRPQLRTSRFGPQMRSGRKTLLTLENCGEPDTHLRPGFSRSIGKTDNTQRPRPRASAIRELVPRAVIIRGYGWVTESPVGGKLSSKGKKPRLRGFFSRWPITGLPKIPAEWSAGGGAPVCGWVPVGPRLCSPDLSAGLARCLRATCVAG
jgi:hypothetical protein